MKLNYVFGAVAACGLIAGAAYAQSSSTSAPHNEGAAGAMTAPGGAAPPAAGMSGSMGANPDGSVNPPASAMTSSSTNPSTGVSSTSATTYGQNASVTVTTTTNGPVPDTAENRAKYGGPMSHAGRHTAAKGD